MHHDQVGKKSFFSIYWFAQCIFLFCFFFFNVCELNVIELETQLPFKMGSLMFNLQYLCGD